MAAAEGPLLPVRQETDESLRTERERADRALAAKLSSIEGRADETVERARGQADSASSKVRERADLKLDQAASPEEARVVVERERAAKDESLRAERAAADESLRREREQHARTLAALLPLERHRTDRNLLTERDRADQALAHRDDFLVIVSHDLRNLLSGIVYSVELLSTTAAAADADADPVATGAQRIQHYAARMNRLIGDLMDVASIDAGKLAIKMAPGDAAALAAEAVETFGAQAALKGIALTLELSDRPLWGEVDHDRFLQVLANLITNAIKFTPSGGEIVVRGARADGGLAFCVSDTGPGIPENMLEAIFERFWQLGENDRRGLGLGLYISRQIVEAHGGRIWAKSRVGEGSEFHFTLPGAPPLAGEP